MAKRGPKPDNVKIDRELLIRRRSRLGILQKDLADWLGYSSDSRISQFELGYSDVPRQKAEQLEFFLGLEAGSLILGVGKEGIRRKEEIKP